MPEPRRSLFPPSTRRVPWLAIVVSLAVHALLFLVKVEPWLPPPRALPDRILLIPLGTEGPQAVEMAFEEPSGGGAPRRPPRSGIRALPTEETGPALEVEPEADTASAAVTPPDPRPADPVAPVRPGPGRGRIGPALGDGSLWVRPLPLPPQDLARVLARTNAELVDSAVTAIVQAYIDSVLTAAPGNQPLPSWTTRVGEQQLGLDAQWIYLGPIKIPTALVAGILNAVGALPVGSSAEMSDYTRFSALQRMREDVQIAARRAQTMDDFKRAIRELRAQREKEREFEKNQRIPPAPPDTSGKRP